MKAMIYGDNICPDDFKELFVSIEKEAESNGFQIKEAEFNVKFTDETGKTVEEILDKDGKRVEIGHSKAIGDKARDRLRIPIGVSAEPSRDVHKPTNHGGNRQCADW